MTGRAVVRPASSDFLKAPSDSGLHLKRDAGPSFEPRILVSTSKKFPRFPNTGHEASYRSNFSSSDFL